MARSVRGLLAAAICCSAPAVTAEPSIDVTPRPAVLCADGERFIAEYEGTNLALYRITDGTVLRRFAFRVRVYGWAANIVLSPDEKRLLVTCFDGSLILWNVETGEQVWQKDPDATGLAKAMDVWFERSANFAANGDRFAYPADKGALVFDARTGDRIGKIDPPASKVATVALSPDGAGGFLLTPDGRLFRFEVATGRVEETGIVAEGWNGNFTDSDRQPPGGWIRYSADGKHIVFPTKRGFVGGAQRSLAVVRLGDKLARRDFDEFKSIGHIRAAPDGSFLVTGHVWHAVDGVPCAGVRIWPDEGRVEELWRFTKDFRIDSATDFSPRTMFGVTPGYGSQRVTVTDLRTGKTVLTVDGPEETDSFDQTASPNRRGRFALWGSLVLVVLIVVFAALLIRRVRRPA